MTTEALEPPRTEQPMRPARLRVPAAVVWVVAFAVFAWGAWTPLLSADESATLAVVVRPLRQAALVVRTDAALEPYYLMMKLWSSVSTAPFWLRLPSILAMATAVAVLFLLAARMGTRRIGGFAAAAMIAFPASSLYAQTARPYAIGVGAVVVAVWCWHAYVTGGRWWFAAGYAASVAVAGLMHGYALLILVPLTAGALVVPTAGAPATRRQAVTRTLIPAAAGLALILPYLVYVARHASGQPDVIAVSSDNVWLVLTRFSLAEQPRLGAAILIASCAGYVLRVIRPRQLLPLIVVGATWLLVFPVVLTLLQLVAGSPGLVNRYWSFALPALALGIGLALGAWSTRVAIGGAIALAVAVVLLVPAQQQARSPDGHTGQRYLDLAAITRLPALHEFPLVIHDWNYRGLTANVPGFPADRMPFVQDPGASGRINPRSSPATRHGALVLRSAQGVIVMVSKKATATPPDLQQFELPAQGLTAFSVPLLRCSLYGYPLGVFVRLQAAAGMDAQTLQRQVEAIAPGQIACVSATSAGGVVAKS